MRQSPISPKFLIFFFMQNKPKTNPGWPGQGEKPRHVLGKRTGHLVSAPTPLSQNEMRTAPLQTTAATLATSQAVWRQLQKALPGQRNNAQTRAQWTAAARADQFDSNEVSATAMQMGSDDAAPGWGYQAARLPWTSLSFRNHRMLAAGLLPEVVHVRVITSPSMAGLVNPVISGRPGTPAWCQCKNREDTRRGRAE